MPKLADPRALKKAVFDGLRPVAVKTVGGGYPVTPVIEGFANARCPMKNEPKHVAMPVVLIVPE